MAHDPIAYDPTYSGLLRPESRPPVEDFSATWERDAICAELSRLAYIRFDEGHEDELTAAMAGAGFTKPRTFSGKYRDDGKDKDAQAFATTIAGAAGFVAFRGTQADKWRDVVADLDFVPCEWGGPGKVHREGYTLPDVGQEIALKPAADTDASIGADRDVAVVDVVRVGL